MIKVLADKHLYHIKHFLPDEVELTLFDPKKNLDEIPEGTQALLIRTVTKINPDIFPTLPKSLKFIGTGSAGTDHVDLPFLRENNIAFADAAGCNAQSVAEYVSVVLLLWGAERDIDITNLNVGIIGAGHTGSAVQKILKKLNVHTIAYDPPRDKRESYFQSSSLNEVLESDVLTFHTPLTHKAKYPTFHWLNEEKLKTHHFKLMINASRGGVIDEQALVEACAAGRVENYVLDVWENEPDFNDETARHAYIKTPHIAGYSVQAKQRASKIISKALANHFNLTGKIPDISAAAVQKTPPRRFWSLPDVLTFYHPIRNYETRLRMLVGRSSKNKIEGFKRIRTSHPLRNEFSALSFPDDLKHAEMLKKLAE